MIKVLKFDPVYSKLPVRIDSEDLRFAIDNLSEETGSFQRAKGYFVILRPVDSSKHPGIVVSRSIPDVFIAEEALTDGEIPMPDFDKWTAAQRSTLENIKRAVKGEYIVGEIYWYSGDL